MEMMKSADKQKSLFASRSNYENAPRVSMHHMKPQGEEMTGEPLYQDYNDYLLSAGLEKSVVNSHNQFVNDISNTHATSGSSKMTELSGDVNDNPYVGLRRPDYNVNIDENARQVPSASAYQYPSNSRYDKGGLF
jgi:hypothetical protein